MIDYPCDKATSEFIVTAPVHYQVVANGLLQDREGGIATHEIAHQWIGDSVTENDWNDVWMSEGFVTYLILLATEHYKGREVLSDLQYQKGAWIRQTLRWEMGTDNFWAGLREYYRRYRNATASTADLVQVMEGTSGEDLDWFFDQWLRRTPSPSVEGSWSYQPASGTVEARLEQTQPGTPYLLDLEVGIRGDGQGTLRFEVMRMTEKRQTFRLSVAKEPGAVVLDPNTWALVQARFERGS
jgi:aminopeptidase N